MPSNAFSSHLRDLLGDTEELKDAHSQLKTGNPGRQYGLGALNRAVIVLSVSAWESYLEQLIREALLACRPQAPPTGLWSALNEFCIVQVKRFHTPNANNVKELFLNTLGLADIRSAWVWRNLTQQQAIAKLDDALQFRLMIAHGVNPRPTIHHRYASVLPDFIVRLARATDDATRAHLGAMFGIQNPWPS